MQDIGISAFFRRFYHVLLLAEIYWSPVEFFSAIVLHL